MSTALERYRARRDFTRTREPAGARGRARRPRSGLRFVVQKHDASHLHYDFRLEMEGVLKSWAVPKGIPTAQGERRLAVEVEDHPLEYGGFEGTIPPGSYGAGTVQLWDRGTYEVAGVSPVQGWRAGKLSLVLHGKKLQGRWTLVRTARATGSKNSWLLIKTGESAPRGPARSRDRSVLSGKTLAEISRGRKTWKSKARSTRPVPGSFKARIRVLDLLASRKKAAPVGRGSR
jgi:bifunctional non-homologous end joining protein LigD